MPRAANTLAKRRKKIDKEDLPDCATCGQTPGRVSVAGCRDCRQLLCTKCRVRRAPREQNGGKQHCRPCREVATKRREKALRERDERPNCPRCYKTFGPDGTCYCKQHSARGKNPSARVTATFAAPGRQAAASPAAAQNQLERLGMQMRAPYMDEIKKIFEEIAAFLSSPRGQRVEPESFDKLGNGYDELFRIFDTNNLEDIFAQIATLTSEYPGVSDAKGLPPGDHQISSPDAEVDCPVLAVTDEQLDEMRSSGQKLPDCVSCVLIPVKDGQKVDDTFEVFQSQCKGWNTSIEYQQYNQLSGDGEKGEEVLTNFMKLEDFLARVAGRGQHPELRRIQAEGEDPINVPSLSAEILGSAFREPEAITTLRYRLLSVLSKRSIRHSPESGVDKESGVGKLRVQPTQLVDLEACLKFLLYGERGSFSGYHMDVLNGTWVQCKTGLKLWLVYCGPWDEEAQKSFAEEDLNWKPAPTTVQAILLRPGDTLIMRPGYPVIHAVLTIEDSFMTGGMIWPECSIAQVMANMGYILQNSLATNEDTPRQLPQILNKLQAHVKAWLEPVSINSFYSYSQSDLDSVERLISGLKEKKLFHCECKGKCADSRCLCKASHVHLSDRSSSKPRV